MALLPFPRPRRALPHALALLLAAAMPASPALARATPLLAPDELGQDAVALPDLQVASVSLSTATAAPGQSVTVTFIVWNLGTATAPSAAVHAALSPDAAITTSDRFLAQVGTTPSLPARYGVRMTRTVAIPADVAGGAQYLGLYADRSNAVAESNESNNGGSKALTVSGGAAPTPSPTATTTPSPTPWPSPPATATPASGLAVLEQQVLVRISEVRAQYGLPAANANALLTNAARRHSNDMAAKGFLSHTGSDGSTLSQRISDAGYAWSSTGEIIAYGYRDAAAVVTGWMNSPGHRAIILTAGYRDFGAGVARSPGGALYWTVDFASPR